MKLNITLKKCIFCVILMLFIGLGLFAGESAADYSPPALSLIFHDFGWNILHSFTHNYGLNFLGACFGTLIFVETGIDWHWRNVVFNNARISGLGLPELYAGYVIPVLTPITAYTIGRFTKDPKLQIAGMALLQTLIVTTSIQAPLKMITGRASPGIVTELDHTKDFRTDNFSNEFNWFNMNFIAGWPSGHTANAFAAAATLSEIYHNNLWLKIGVYTYAAIIGVGVTLDVHWASDALAGALIGYAIGKTVGRSFRRLLEGDSSDRRLSFYVTHNSLGVAIKK